MNVLNYTNVMPENTLQLSLWRHVLNFIIVTKNSQYNLHFQDHHRHHHRQHLQHHLSHHHYHHYQHQQHYASLNYKWNRTVILWIAQSFKSVPTKDSPFPHLLKSFEMEFGPQKVKCLYLYILFFAYFLFRKTQWILFLFSNWSRCTQITWYHPSSPPLHYGCSTALCSS